MRLDPQVISPPVGGMSGVPGYRKHDQTPPVATSPLDMQLNLSSEGMQLLGRMSREEQSTFMEFQRRLQDSQRHSTEASFIGNADGDARHLQNSLNKSSSYIMAGIGPVTDESTESFQKPPLLATAHNSLQPPNKDHY